MGSKNNKTTPRLISTAERRVMILDLRKRGLTYRAIAAAIIEEFGAEKLPRGFDDFYAAKDVQRELKKLRDTTAEDARDIKDMELLRLNALLDSVWEQAKDGSIPHINTVLRITERISKLLGLDAPIETKIDAGGVLLVLDGPAAR